jgi:hypothetical protein
MSFTASQIEEIVNEIELLKANFTHEEISKMEKFNEFKTQNKILYEMVCSEEGVNKNIFNEMMKMKRRLESGEDQYSVDVKFGRFMAHQYIDPVIKKK